MAILFDSILIDLMAIATSLITITVAYFSYSYKYWEKKGVPYIKPVFPYGNNDILLSNKPTFGIDSKIWYDELKKRGHKFGGIWTLARPVLVLVDPDFIKDIMSKDFQYFVDRDIFHNDKDDPISAHLFTINSESWKNIRAKLTPTFTSGKMKMMFDLVAKCSDHMIEAMDSCVEKNASIDIRLMLSSFTIDVIGTCAFGIECNSFKDPNAEFLTMGKRIFEVDFWRSLKLSFLTNFPEFSVKMGFKSTRKDVSQFFYDAVAKTVKFREDNGMTRPDFLQLLMDLKNKSKNNNTDEKPFTFDQLVANVFLFFIAGFDTSSTTMNFALYELARNPNLQERVRKEIEKVLEPYDGKINYDNLKEMTYLGQVIDEALRLFPALPSLSRVCVKDYKLRDTNIVIEKGTPVVISTLGLHRDPEYFPDPLKFDPDRFTPENKSKRHPYVHLPFGEGPRNCIGLRFGLMQSKIGLIRILRKYRLSISPKTKMPLTLNDRVFLLKSNETLYLKAEKL